MPSRRGTFTFLGAANIAKNRISYDEPTFVERRDGTLMMVVRNAD